MNVYVSFPEKLFELIPDTDVIDKQFQGDPWSFFQHKNDVGVLSNYVFKSEYLGFPVVGLSVRLYQLVLRWMTDKYNENQCITHEFFEEEGSQIDMHCFYIESLLSDQYLYPRTINDLET